MSDDLIVFIICAILVIALPWPWWLLALVLWIWWGFRK